MTKASLSALALLVVLASSGGFATAHAQDAVLHDDAANLAGDSHTFADRSAELTALHEAAESGDATARFNLGTRYLNGDGVAVDNFEALRWFKLAADHGNASAQYNIAVMYLNGIGVIPDPEQAVEWFVTAAENGDPPAQFTLAVLLFNGQLGVPQNLPHAYKWFLLAGAAGDQTAAANAVLIQELLPAGDAAAMQREALEWIESFQQRGDGAPSNDQ